MRKSVQVLSVTLSTTKYFVCPSIVNPHCCQKYHLNKSCPLLHKPQSEPENSNGRISHNPDHIVCSIDVWCWTGERTDAHLSHSVPKNQLSFAGSPSIRMLTSGRRVMGWACLIRGDRPYHSYIETCGPTLLIIFLNAGESNFYPRMVIPPISSFFMLHCLTPQLFSFNPGLWSVRNKISPKVTQKKFIFFPISLIVLEYC
jgi:hypothetical protein